MKVLVRVRPSVRGRLTSGRPESAAFAHILGRPVGHVWEWRWLSDAQIKALEGTAVEVRLSDADLPHGMVAGDYRRVGGAPVGRSQGGDRRRTVITGAIVLPMVVDGKKRST